MKWHRTTLGTQTARSDSARERPRRPLTGSGERVQLLECHGGVRRRTGHRAQLEALHLRGGHLDGRRHRHVHVLARLAPRHLRHAHRVRLSTPQGHVRCHWFCLLQGPTSLVPSCVGRNGPPILPAIPAKALRGVHSRSCPTDTTLVMPIIKRHPLPRCMHPMYAPHPGDKVRGGEASRKYSSARPRPAVTHTVSPMRQLAPPQRVGPTAPSVAAAHAGSLGAGPVSASRGGRGACEAHAPCEEPARPTAEFCPSPTSPWASPLVSSQRTSRCE